MKLFKTIFQIIMGTVLFASIIRCSGDKLEQKGFAVSTHQEEEGINQNDVHADSLQMHIRPASVLLTGHPQYRLTTLFKVNYNKKRKTTFIGSNAFHNSYTGWSEPEDNRWKYNFMPGISAVYG